MNWKELAPSALALAAIVMISSNAQAVNLVQNGDFETVDLGAANGSGTG